MTDIIFKILTRPEWDVLRAAGEFLGSEDDKRDGFVHLSTREQLQGTLDKHYSAAKTGGDDLVLAAFEAAALGGALKYETSRGGQAFPHLYAPLPLSALLQHWGLPCGEDGRYDADTQIKHTDEG